MKSKKDSQKKSKTSGNDFPILSQKINGKRLVYLDSAATSQKPKQVIDAISKYYKQYNSNVHRGVHKLSQEATQEYEGAREKIAKFINAEKREIVFTKNTSEAINLVMYSWAKKNLKSGDEIAISILEHHSNLVPWQTLQKKGIRLNYIDIDKDGKLLWEKKITLMTKLVAITHASNVLGTINPIKEIAKEAHKVGAKIIVDGAQSVPHMPVNVKDLDVDFLAFSAHKMLGPTGVGVLYGKAELLEGMEPFIYGGDMIKDVGLYNAKWNDIPWKFEAGTPNIADVIGFGFAIDYLNNFGMENVRKHEEKLMEYALKKLAGKVKIYGPMQANERVGVISFTIEGIHPHDIASILDSEGIAIRSGHLCALPLMKRLGINSLARASTYIYNTKEDIDALAAGIEKVKKVFK